MPHSTRSSSLPFRFGALAVFSGVLLWWIGEFGVVQVQRDPNWSPRLVLNVFDESTGDRVAARFTVTVDGTQQEPRWLGPHGLRFVSVHVAKRQSQVVTYARATGPVWVPLTPDAKRVRVDVVKGLDYLPVSIEADVRADPTEVTAKLKRWNRLREDGWRAADAHLHYDRVEPAADRDWLAMMAGDDIAHSQFMTLKGGMVPGIWARQFAFGEQGEAVADGRTIAAGEEYRDSLQGHVLLFGLDKLIEPITTGTPESPENFPALATVLGLARGMGGLVGAAHGGALGGSPSLLADAILGAAEFVEIANWGWTFWPLNNWYRLMNCGFHLPPTAGTDLPNNPRRASWQPFLGGMRMYANTGEATGSEAWNRAVRQGATFVTSGPIIELSAEGAGPGETLCLPRGGREVRVSARIRSPMGLHKIELVRDGRVVNESTEERHDGAIQSISLGTSLRFDKSGWIAARGEGKQGGVFGGSAVAHTAAIRILVGGEPVWSEVDGRSLVDHIEGQKVFYAENGRYLTQADRRQMTTWFDRAIEELRARQEGRGDSTGCAQ